MKNRLARIGLILVSLLVFTALFAPFLAPYDPTEQKMEEGLNPPSSEHLFGQDRLGRDILSRIVYGSRISLWVGISTVSVSVTIGLIIGSVTGYYGGLVDLVIMRLIDILQAFPGILLAISIVAILGPSLNHVILALCLIGWVGYARVVRGQVLFLREYEYVTAAKALGASSTRVIIHHIIPNLLAPVLVQATFGMAGAVLAEAGLSFLGLGTQPPTPSWGSMLNDGRQFLLVAPHLTTFPGLAMMTVVLGFNFLGDGLRDRLDVKSM
jgi:peptide/nickel transport system permease protein